MSKIAVVGTGYVGLTTGAYLAHLGHTVVCADVVPEKVERLSRGDVPIVEPGLEELVKEGLESSRLRFVLGAAEGAKGADFVFLCVPTPQGEDGSADLTYVQAAAQQIAPVLAADAIVINKSTVPVGSTRVVEAAMERNDVYVVSNPEFLREGSAVHDCLHPDRIVIGADYQPAAARVAELFAKLQAPVVITDPASAETIKYAANAFLATKISFVNAMAHLCEAVGADIKEVALGMGYDKRIGFEFLRPGPGWGGSCFVGDETVLIRRGETISLRSFAEVDELCAREGVSGLEVLSWSPDAPSPDFMPVAAFTRREYDGPVVDIRTKMGRRLTVTADHPMVIGDASAEATGITLAGDLTTGDWLPIAQSAPILWSEETSASLLDVLPLIGVPELEDDVPVEVPYTDALWKVVGLFLAEGHIGSDGARRRICWSFHPENEQHLVDEVANFWRGLGVKVTVRRLSTTMQVSISSRILAGWFEHILGVGSNCYDKRVPDVIWSQPPTARRALLHGLWEGDGSWSLISGGPSVVLEYGTVSRALADAIVRLLAEWEIVARVKVGRTAKSTVDTYWIAISGAESVRRAASFLLPPDEYQTVRAHGMNQARWIAPTGYRRSEKGTAWARVVSHEARPYVGPVYSLEVPGTHTVVTSFGLIAHNCFPKDSRALVRIAEDAGYDFSLLKGVIRVNSDQYDSVADKIRTAAGGSLEGKTVGIWGLTFKANTDDLRDSPSLYIIDRLVAMGATVKGYDVTQLREHRVQHESLDTIELASDAYAAADGADVLAVLTEWDEFRWLDFNRVKEVMAAPAIVDGRNLLDGAQLRQRGFSYAGIGRA